MAPTRASSRVPTIPEECAGRQAPGRPAVLLLLCLSFGHLSGFAEGLLPLEFGPWKIKGALRFGHAIKDYDDSSKPWGKLEFDTFKLGFDFDWNNIIASGEARYYRYIHLDNQDYTMLHHAWAGYRFSDEQQVQVGVHQVPFGILPWASHNFYFQLPYYLGLEDDYDLGVKHIFKQGEWDLQLAYYVRDEGTHSGDSEHSARYGYDLVEELGSANKERHQVNSRVARRILHDESSWTEVGLSFEYGLTPNGNTDSTGDRYAAALHLNGTYGRWNVMLEAIRYGYDLENPAGEDNRTVAMGAFDFPYLVAARGTMLCAGVSYCLPVDWKWVDSLTFYNDYGILFKDADGFEDTQQEVVGTMVTAGRFLIYVDFIFGKHHPWVNPAFTNSLGAGGDDDWHFRFNLNVGYYF